MKYLIIVKPDPFCEGIQDHILEADSMERTDDSIVFYRHGYSIRTTKYVVAFYRIDFVVMAGEMRNMEPAVFSLKESIPVRNEKQT